MRPRQILPGTVYMVTRRTTQRQFLLKPSKKVNEALVYCLALAQQRTGLAVHALCILSNHYHQITTDPGARLPEFTTYFNGLVARCLNAHYDRWENFWASAPPSYVRLETEDAVVDKTAYTLANPVAGGLVKYGSHWPGVRLFRPGRYVARRPKFFFRDEAGVALPDKVALVVTAPPIGSRAAAAVARIEEAVRERESDIRRKFKAAGRKFLGPAAVLRQRITDSPTSREPRRGLSPQLACGDKWRRIERLQELKEFVVDHEAARQRWLTGQRDVEFPAGTWAMRVYHSVSCAARCAET